MNVRVVVYAYTHEQFHPPTHLRAQRHAALRHRVVKHAEPRVLDAWYVVLRKEWNGWKTDRPVSQSVYAQCTHTELSETWQGIMNAHLAAVDGRDVVLRQRVAPALLRELPRDALLRRPMYCRLLLLWW